VLVAARPKGATRPPRARLADRDEYPPLGAPVKVATRSGIIMGPPPRVQLTLRSTTASPTLSIVMPVVVAPVKRPPKRDTTSAFARPTPPVQIPEPTLAVATVPEVPLLVPKAPLPVPEVSVTGPVALSMPETIALPALAGRPLVHRQETAARALSPQEVGSLDSPLSRKAVIERTRHIVEQGRRRQVLLVAASVVVIAGVFLGALRYTASAGAAAQPNTNWNQIVTTTASAVASASASASATTSASTAAATAASVPVALPTAAATAAATSEWMGVLTKNPTYGQSLAVGSCDPLGTPGTTARAQTVISEYVECMNVAWGKILTASNRSFKNASVEFFVNTAVSPCGTYNPDVTNAAYCLNNTTLYVSSSALKKAAGDRYYAAELVTHEYAHHVQNLTGILTAAHQQWAGTDEYSRRIEMQAHCLSFAVLSRVPGFNVTPTDLAMFRAGWAVGPNSARFGSIASQQMYGEKGLAATTVGDCETFSAASVS
jgi:hypothetical protein